ATYTVVDDAGDTSGSILTGYDPNGVGADPVMSATNAAYQDSLTANIVVIGPFGEHDERVVQKFPALGTEMTFEQDYDALVMSYLNLASKPKVYITTPILVPSFDQATQTLVTNVVLPAVNAVGAKHSDVKLIDLYTAFLNHTEFFMGMGDGQTNATGEKKLEQMVFDAILASSAGGMGGAGGTGAGGSGGASGGTGGSTAGAAAGAGGQSTAGTGGASGGAGSSTASTSGGSTASGGTTPQTVADTAPSQPSGCSITTGAERPGEGLAWLALATAVSGLTVTRLRRRARR
ncbi:MAG TPA: hypothetical protein VNW92_02395, partial [Polyangiaceae bacterium]|nr:hypothetical protein [Polyangiaceae bacterium]